MLEGTVITLGHAVWMRGYHKGCVRSQPAHFISLGFVFELSLYAVQAGVGLVIFLPQFPKQILGL